MQEEKKPKKNKMTLYRFTDRVLMINLPTAVCLLLLVIIQELSPIAAVITFGTVVMISILIIIPFMEQLQSIADYSKELSQSIKEGKDIPLLPDKDSGDEYSHIIGAINQIHNIWTTQSEELKTRYLSDSAVLDVLPDPLLLLGTDGSIVGANSASRELFGNNIRAEPLERFITSEDALKAIKEVLKGEEEKKFIEITTASKTPKILSLKIERLPALAHSGAIVTLVFHDVTESRKLEQMQADFVANASHELRTPLSVISGFIETLEGPAKDDSEARKKFLSIMGEQATRMSRLIENLLSLSRIQMQSTPPEGKVEIKELITGIVLALEPRLKENRMKVETFLPNAPPVLGIASEISQVFQNLIDNAIKYGRPGTTIKITSRLSDDLVSEKTLVYVSVNNQGDIIPAEFIPRISERFYRVDNEKTRNRSGSGLGLAIVSRILERHGGNMKITSQPEEGTTFTVSFQVAPKKGTETTRKAKS